MKHLKNLFLVGAVVIAIAIPSFAEDEGDMPYRPLKQSRQKKLEFDDGLVEGINKKPGDVGSLTIKERNRKKNHLYNRELQFDTEMTQTIKDMRYE